MKPSHLVLLLTMNFFWAGVYSTYKLIGDDLPTGGIVTLRFGLAAACFVLMWPWLPGRAPRGKALLSSCIMGLVLFVAGQRLQVYGNHLGTAGDSSILMALEPLITSVAAALVASAAANASDPKTYQAYAAAFVLVVGTGVGLGILGSWLSVRTYLIR